MEVQDYAMDEPYGNGAENQEQQFTEPAAEVQDQSVVGDASTRPGDRINASRNEDDDRKIFVGGVSWETTLQELKDYFAKFGEVQDCTLKTDPTTGRSRGFGFVLFAEGDSVDRVLAEKAHVLKGKTIDPKRAKARGGREPIKKIFVGGMDPNTSEEELRTHFGQFGTIENVEFAFDRAKNVKRGFCFITFETEAMVDQCCAEPRQQLGSKEVEVKKAVPKDDEFGGGRGGRGGRGGGRGRGRGGSDYGGGWGGYGSGYGGYGGYGGGYDYGYGGGYGGYGGGYDYGYGAGGGYPGYDYYGGWAGYGSGYVGGSGYGADAAADQSAYGKAKRGGSAASSSYHPYQR